MKHVHPEASSAVRAKPRTALVIVDMLESQRASFTYENGTVGEGLARMAELIKAARSAGAPVVLLSGYFSNSLAPEILDAAGPDGIRACKRGLSAFSSPDFPTIMNAFDIDTLVVGGWIRHICVRATISDALGRGYAVRTSDHVLFGNRETLNLQARRICLDYFRQNCSLLGTSAELAAAIEPFDMPRV